MFNFQLVYGDTIRSYNLQLNSKYLIVKILFCHWRTQYKLSIRAMIRVQKIFSPLEKKMAL